MEHITLNNGISMPALGLGVFQMTGDQVREVVPAALDAGYRLLDTASRYYNEEDLGAAIAESAVPREELFVTTKLWFKDHGYEATRTALQVSLDKLGLDYLDLWLVHQPFNDYYGSWRAMEELLSEGLVRAIGVSNFYPDRYYDLARHNDVAPAVNQLRLNPYDQRRDAREISAKYGTALQAWAPLGHGGEVLHDPVLVGIAREHDRSVAQVILRWIVQTGASVVVKSVHVERLRENIDVFDFTLTDAQIAAIDALDRRETGNGGPDHHDPAMLDRLYTFE